MLCDQKPQVFHISLFLLSMLAIAIAHPLQSLAPLTSGNLTLDPGLFNEEALGNITSINSREIGCFKQTAGIQPYPTTRLECEIFVDNWVRGQDLVIPRLFSQKPGTGPTDIHLPSQLAAHTCAIYVNTVNYDDELTLSLADIYAEVMGPGMSQTCQFCDRLSLWLTDSRWSCETMSGPEKATRTWWKNDVGAEWTTSGGAL